jgi:hyperosmotically inducible periplasmic protein
MGTRKVLCAVVAAVALVGVGACTSDPQKKETAGEYASDTGLTAKVKTAIATDVGARTAAGVNVETYKGTVQLSGFVDSQDQATRAADAAKKVDGVRSVKNDIRVKQ